MPKIPKETIVAASDDEKETVKPGLSTEQKWRRNRRGPTKKAERAERTRKPIRKEGRRIKFQSATLTFLKEETTCMAATQLG